MTIGERIIALRKALSMSQVELSRQLKITQSALCDLEKGKSNPSFDTISSLYRIIPNLSGDWLISGLGEMFMRVHAAIGLKEEKKRDFVLVNADKFTHPADFLSRTFILPVLSEISGGEPYEPAVNEPLEHIELPRSILRHDSTEYAVFRVNGRSMEPNFMHEDYVAVWLKAEWENCHEKVCAVRLDFGLTLKKVILDPRRRAVLLQPFNARYNTITIEEDDWQEMQLIGIAETQFRLL